MVAIFSGNSTGFERSSRSMLGNSGLLGSAALGRSGEQVFVNASNGNLLISQKDEFLVGRGPDAAIARTYNSLGDLSDDNGDNWRQGTDRRIYGLTGTLNTAGSTVRRVSADGSDILYSWDAAKSAYVTPDGDGAYDQLTSSAGVWTWTDGSNQLRETYAAYGAIWRISQQLDTDGNAITFTYSGANLTQVSTADGGTITYEWSGNRITRIVTSSQAASLARTYYSYDTYGRLNGVTLDLSPNDFTVGSGATYTTTYTYDGTSRRVASIAQTDGSRIDIAYDSSNRVTTLTETIASGVTRTTTLAYGAGYTNVTDPTGQVTRFDYVPSANVAAAVDLWGSSNVTKEAATIGGAAATKFTVQTTAWSAISQGVAVAAGDTVTFGVTMQAVGTVTSQSLGLYSDIDGWGAAGISSARIVSGPGTLVQAVGGLWTINGLSTTQGTRIEVTRTYKVAQTAGAYLYFDHPGGYRAGTSLILADASLMKSATATNVNLMDLNNWYSAGVARTAAGTIDGAAAYKYSVQTGGGWSAVYAGVSAAKGDSYSLSLSLQASDGYTSQSFGLYGDATGWGNASVSTARIVSGPGTLTQAQGGLWTISGLSATQVTRVEIIRNYEQDESGGAYIYADLPGNFRAGASLTIAAAHLTKRIVEPATAQLLTKITAPPAQSGGAAQVVQFAYSNKGDLVSVTDAAGNATTYTHDSAGNVLTETDRLGNVITRTYGSKNELLTETRYGSDSAAADSAHTTRYVYDGENHLRYVVSAEGSVIEYRYDRYGLEIAKLEYPESTYNLSGLASGASIAESTLNAWVSALPDRSSVKRTNTYYDVRGNVSSVVTTSTATKYGEGADSVQTITPGANTTVSAEADGSYRITKTSGSAGDWDADAHSLIKAEGDFVLRLRPVQNNKYVVAGLSTAPAVNASYTNPEYGLYFVADGTVYYMESGSYVYLNTTYAAGDVFWIQRTGTTISYYKGATLGAAQAAGALRTRTSATEALYFDSSFYQTGAALDVIFNPFDINTGVGTAVVPQSDGSYRLVKSGTADGWDQDARSTIKADGDFVLRLKPAQNNKHMVGGVALSPGASASYTNPDYGFYFNADGSVYHMEAGSYVSLGVTHAAGENFWLVRSGTTISYYKGSTLEAAMAAGALRTRTGATGTLYFDSSFYSAGAAMEADFRPATAIANGVNTVVSTSSDGLYRITKTGGTDGIWDADARSSTRTDGDFVLRLRPAQATKHVIGGVATTPSASAYYTNPDYGLFFLPDGTVHYMEAGNYSYIGATYVAGDNFWLTRVGNTISYYKGATLEAAIAAGALRTRTGVTGTFHFDSSFHGAGAVMDVAFTPAEANGSSAVLSRTSFVYDQAGQLLSRQTDGQSRESFVYDGLGRTIASTDLNGGATTVVFNDSATQTVVTLASGLVRTATYNKVGDLVSSTESGSYVAGGTATYKYDKLDRVRMTTDAAGFNKYYVYDKVGRLVAEVLHNGSLTEYRYDANNRVVATLRYINMVSAANLATLADPNSAIEMAALRPAFHASDICTWQIYDKEGRVTATMDGSGSVKTFQYDKSGRLVKSTAYANRLDAGVYTAFKTTTPTAVTLPSADAARDSVARNFYDKDGLLLAALDGEGFLSRAIYDRSGQKVEEIAYLNPTNAGYRVSGTLDELVSTQPTDANDRRTRYVYDGQGQLRFVVDAFSQVTEYGYDAAHLRTQTIRYAGAIAATGDYTYDNVKSLVAASGLSASAATRRDWAVYDPAGRIAYAIDAEDGVTRFSYDNRGQIVRTVQYAGKRSTTSAPSLSTMDSWAAAQNANAANRVTRAYYSARGELRFTVDAEGFVKRTDFDAAGRVTREVSWDGAISINDSSTIDTVNALATSTWVDTRYGYDFGGALTDVWNGENNWTHYVYYGTQKIASIGFQDSDPSWTYYNYDGAGRVVEELEANGTTEGTRIAYAYDGHGNVVSQYDAKNEVTTRSYDRLGRILTQTDRLGSVTSYQYNAFGEAAKVTDARGNSTWNYFDRLGRLTATRDRENYVTETAYNVFGDALSVTRRYNRANNVASVSVPPTYVAHAQDSTTTLEYDRLGRLVKTTDAMGFYEQYTLDALGNRTSVRNKVGGIVTNSYDRRGLLLTETLPMASFDVNGNSVAASVVNKFEYDARGNRTKTIDAFGLAEQRTTLYLYDKANRLTETRGDAVGVTSQANHIDVSSVVPTEKIKYDQRGRIIEKTDALGARTLFYYDKKNRKVAEIGALGTYTAYTYDKNGNVLTERVYGTAVTLPVTAGGAAPAAPGGEYREKSYAYDKLDRLKTSSIANLRTGAWNGSYYATGVGTVTTTFDYDSNGNLTKTTDAAAGTAFAFYDKADRRVAEVDAENYLTFNTLDGDGNVTQEERLAVKLPGAVTAASDPTALRSSVAGNAADRITQFGYDRNGRRISETRLYINSNNVGSNGALGTDAVHGTIQYGYNGLGQALQKTFANGDYVSYVYDATGRLLQESRSPYTDQNGATVRPTTFYYYNGLNNLAMTRQGAMTQAAGDRFTRYAYGAGGRLATMTDATGAVYDYRYDAAGNVVRESWVRLKGDGSSVTDGLLYTRDLLGRVISQAFANAPGSYWVKGDTQDSAYNAYGEVYQRGVNGLWQEQFAYDGAGRLWRTNSGDGVWRYFAYDGAGRQTLVLESEGTNLANLSFDQALAVATANGAYYVGGAYIDGINATITAFDKRGLAVQTRAPKRQLNDTAAAQDFTVGRTYNGFGEVATETDARGFTTDYTYNTMGRLIRKQSPTVNQTGENGAVSSARPTEDYYYDRAGRMIGVRNANGNLTTRALLAGTGHDGSEALVTYEYHPDGGFIRHDYDVFGDRRISWDEISRRTDMAYDAKGRLTQVTHPIGLIDYFGYDILGQKIAHWNNFNQIPVYGPPEQVWVEDPPYWDPYYGWVYPGGHYETQTPIIGYTPEKEITDYDLQGRVTRQVAFGGDTTTTSYAWNGGIATGGMGTFGGWTETTTMANGRSTTEQTDLFGRQVYRSDLGGHVYTFSYDLAGRTVQRTSGETLNYTWLNTGKVAQSFSATGTQGSQNWTRKGTTYGYDASGNLVSERLADEGHSYYEYWDPYYGYQYSDYGWSNVSKNATATYDGMNRLVSWAEAGSGLMPGASTSYEYDLVGNIRRSYATYRSIDANGTPSAYVSTQDNWYRYDGMNRLVTRGALAGGQIVRGNGGVDYLYNQAGERIRATHTTTAWASIYDPNGYWDPYYGWQYQYISVPYDADSREDYTYDAAGALATVRIAESGYYDNGDGTLTVTPPPATGALRATYTHDLMGRLTHQVDWLGDGTNAAYDRNVTYNGKGQVYYDTVINKQGADTITTNTSSDFGAGSAYALGAVVYSSSSNYKNGAYQNASSTTNSYTWYDGAMQSQISYKPNTSQSTTYTTTFTYDGSGSLSSIYVGDGRPRTVTFINDANGQAIKRDESDNSYANGDPHDIWYRFGGKQMGAVGNNGTLDTDYATSITNRTRTSGTGAFRFGATYGAAYADFDQSNEAISSYSQGVASGSYTARQGDTLETIAANLWGDSSLWYKLAEANGMAAANGLVEGQRLIIPAGVMKSRHNATTFKPFDPAETLGDINPTTPQPQKAKKGGKCGVFGIILLVVIAVAVTAITAGAAVAALSPTIGSIGAGMSALATATTGLSAGALIGIGAASSALGSIVSQGFGVATGIQEKFDWKGVAMAAVGGAVGAGIGPGGIFGQSGAFGNMSNAFVSGALRGALSSAVTQGVGVATGLQKKFDWAGVAAAGVGGGVSSWVGGKIGPSVNKYVGQFISGAAGAIAGAATRSLVTGTDFGDNLLAALPDVVGSTIGNMIADAVERATTPAVPDPDPEPEPEPMCEPEPAPVDDPNLDGGAIAFAGHPLLLAMNGELPIGLLAGLNLEGSDATFTLASLQGLPPPQEDPYTADNLDLGVNERFRDQILQASRESGLPPQTVAAIISAEAATIGRTGVWDVNSANGTTTARGLTQFLEGTWMTEAARTGSYLNGVAREGGYLDRRGRFIASKRADFLRLRFDAQHSISAATDYAKFNLAALRTSGADGKTNLILDETPGALAKYAYIAHHEGLGGARAYLQGTLQIPLSTWNANVPSTERAGYLRRNNNDRNLAYRDYMNHYIDNRIDVRRFMVDATVRQGRTRVRIDVPSTTSLYH
jgi:YD repeat-containing protein